MSLTRILVLLLPMLGVVTPGEPRCAHPQDGPDVDLRVRIDRDRVEIEARLNLCFADEVAPMPRANPDFVAEDELSALRSALVALFDREVVLSVDGQALAPDENRFEEQPWDPDDAEFFPRMGIRAVQRFLLARTYRLERAPTAVGLVWKLYPRDLALAGIVDQKVALKAEWSAGRDLRIVDLSETEPEFIWHAPPGSFERPRPLAAAAPEEPVAPWPDRLLGALFLGLLAALVVRAGSGRTAPARLALAALAGSGAGLLLLSAGAGGAPPRALDDGEAEALFLERLRGIYDAFSFGEEGDVYDALSASVSENLIQSVYDEVHQQLVMREEGGAVARVRSLDPVATRVVARSAEGDAIDLEARWQVEGEVYHWGHTHSRRNEYHARYGLRRTARGWLIDSTRPLAQERIELDSGELPR